MPESIAAAEAKKQITAIEVSIKELAKQRTETRNEVTKLKQTISQVQQIYRSHAYTLDLQLNVDYIKANVHAHENRIARLQKDLVDAKSTDEILRANIHRQQHNIEVIRTGGNVIGEEKKEARKFIMPCPNGDCRGYLSSQYKCELCEHFTCSNCFDVIGLTKDAGPSGHMHMGTGPSGHMCKQENVESAEYIKKQSKPCPCCGTRISKIDGCDQMWCTQCHKAFSWNTGKIITGTIHNPHFYQYQRANGNAPRNPGDVVCGGLCDIIQLNRLINHSLVTISSQAEKEKLFATIFTIHRLQVHITHMELNPLRNQIRNDLDFEAERVQYILQEISKTELASRIIRRDNARKKHVAILFLYELLTAVGIDMFNSILAITAKGEMFMNELNAHIAEYNTLRMYCNEHFKEIGMLYGICVPFIDDSWKLDTTKYNSKGETDKYIEKRDEKRAERKLLEEKRHEKRMEEYREIIRQREQLLRTARSPAPSPEPVEV
jgi:hypothetical protein